jgi:Baseplate J-like protein
MSLPTPKLDDRDWDDLVSEAKRRIAASCPAWTDFNPSDPGMTLVELMAWMTETVLYRLNRIPELNFIKFLELIGVRLQPARPARTWVFFQAQNGVNEEELKPIPIGTALSTLPQRDRDPVAFATVQDLELTTRKIIKICSRSRMDAINEVEESFDLSEENPSEIEIFLRPDIGLARGQAVPHHLYLGDPALAEFGTENIALGVMVEVEKSMEGHLFLDWQAWDGETWKMVRPDEDTTVGLRQSGTLVFGTLPSMKKCDQAQLKQVAAEIPSSEGARNEDALWLRARLTGSQVKELPRLLKVQRQIDLKGCRVRPLKAFAETPPPQNLQYPFPIAPPKPLETSTDFYPLGIKAERGSAFYLGSGLFQKRGATITIQFDLRKELKPARIEVLWEYFSRDGNWKPLGASTQNAVTSSEHQLQDGTKAFTRSGSGKVEFECPEDVAPISLGGESGLFIRARVEDAGFENDNDARLVVRSLLLGFTNHTHLWACCVSENYSEFSPHLPGLSFSPFRIDPQRDPAFYLCFDDRPSSVRGPYQLFLEAVPQKVHPEEARISWAYEPLDGWGWQPIEPSVKPQSPILIWEYSAPDREWRHLNVQDGTEGFVHPGMLTFHCPRDWEKTVEFNQAGFWLRVRWEIAEFLFSPRLRRVLLNGVEVEQSIRQESILGSSNGLANQSFSLYTSILESPEIWIRESGVRSDEEASSLKRRANVDVLKEEDGYWVKWAEKPNLSRSRPDDRHFTVYLGNGTIEFGDGEHGAIPPPGTLNVFASYRVTDGSGGNVGRKTIVVLEKPLQQVQGVTNVHPAEGGCDRENIERAKQRGPWEIVHRDRAVTTDDFIALAKKASPLVARAECYGENGVIHVVIVPKDNGEHPQPSRRVIEDVSSYLDFRRLINTRISVEGPVYEAIDLEAAVVLDTLFLGRFSEVKKQIEESLRSFVHPLSGMDDASGWPIGRALHLSELYYRLEKLKGVDHVDLLRIRKSGTGHWENRVKIGDHSFPRFSGEMKIEQSFG